MITLTLTRAEAAAVAATLENIIIPRFASLALDDPIMFEMADALTTTLDKIKEAE